MEKKAPFKPALLVPNCESDYQIQDLGLKVVLDKNLRKMGIWIPETILDENVKSSDSCCNDLLTKELLLRRVQILFERSKF